LWGKNKQHQRAAVVFGIMIQCYHLYQKKHDLVLLAGVRVTSNTDKCMGSGGKDVFLEPKDVITKKVKLEVEGNDNRGKSGKR